MKPIVAVPNPVLSATTSPVTQFDKKLSKLVADMKATLLATVNPKGVGLAAPQIGISLAVFVTKPTPKAAIRVFINPTIIEKSSAVQLTNDETDERTGKLEGCLSIPKIWGNVKRSQTLTLRYQDETGAAHEETFKGFMATIVQHETDHINGILFTQRVLEQQGKLYQVTSDPDGKETLDEIHL